MWKGASTMFDCFYFFPPRVREFGNWIFCLQNPESDKFKLWKPGILGFGIQLKKFHLRLNSGIQVPMEIIWDPNCWIQNSSLSWNNLSFYMDRYFLRSFWISQSKNFNDGFFSVRNQNSGQPYLPLIHVSGGLTICSHVGLFQFCLIVKKKKKTTTKSKHWQQTGKKWSKNSRTQVSIH